MDTYPSILEQSITLSTYLSRRRWPPTYLSSGRWPPPTTYLGGDDHLFTYLGKDGHLSTNLGKDGKLSIYFGKKKNIYLSTYLPKGRWPPPPTYLGGDDHLFTYQILGNDGHISINPRKDGHLSTQFGKVYLLIYLPI